MYLGGHCCFSFRGKISTSKFYVAYRFYRFFIDTENEQSIVDFGPRYANQVI